MEAGAGGRRQAGEEGTRKKRDPRPTRWPPQINQSEPPHGCCGGRASESEKGLEGLEVMESHRILELGG